MVWFLYGGDLHHERVKRVSQSELENLAKKLQLQDMCLVNEINGIFQQMHICMLIL